MIQGQSTQSDHIFQNNNQKEVSLTKYNDCPGSLSTW